MPESHGAGALMLGDLGPAPDPHPRRAVGEEDIAHVEAGDLAEPEARAQGQGEDHVVPRMRRRYPQQAPPLGFGQDLRGEVGRGEFLCLRGSRCAERKSSLLLATVVTLEYFRQGSTLFRGLLG